MLLTPPSARDIRCASASEPMGDCVAMGAGLGDVVGTGHCLAHRTRVHGLLRCQSFVESHRGRITAANEAEGGAVFRVELLVVASAEATTPDVVAPVASACVLAPPPS